MLLLDGPAGVTWARLLDRRLPWFRPAQLTWEDVPDPAAAVAQLEAGGWVDGLVPAEARLSAFTVPELKAALARHRLRRGGRRAELVERLLEAGLAPTEPVRRLARRSLVRRLELLAFESAWRGRKTLLLERIGVTRHVDHPVTAGPPVFARRTDLLSLEQSLGVETDDPEGELVRIDALPARPVWLAEVDPRRFRARAVRHAARELERRGEAARAANLYAGLLERRVGRPERLAPRLALALEAAGDPERALQACVTWRDRVAPSARPAMERTGRRLARKLGHPWRPLPPLVRPRRRRVWLPAAERRGPRPLWGDPPLAVEAAVARALSPRVALHGENQIWTTLFGLLLGELYWLPVPGMLPSPGRSGPRDLGTPAFAEHRAAELGARLQAVRRGELRLADRWARWAGRSMRGVRWGLAPVETLEAFASSLGPGAVAAVLERLAREGWAAARGLPDLAILPGEALRIDAIPARVGAGALLVEVKGPTDSLSDEQKVWLDVLTRAGAPVEVWDLRPRG